MICPRCDMAPGPLAGRALPKHAVGCPKRSGRKRRQPELASLWQTKALANQTGGMVCTVTRATDDEVQFLRHYDGREFVIPRSDFCAQYERYTSPEQRINNRWAAFTTKELHDIDHALFAGSVESQISDEAFEHLSNEVQQELRERGVQT